MPFSKRQNSHWLKATPICIPYKRDPCVDLEKWERARWAWPPVPFPTASCPSPCPASAVLLSDPDPVSVIILTTFFVGTRGQLQGCFSSLDFYQSCRSANWGGHTVMNGADAVGKDADLPALGALWFLVAGPSSAPMKAFGETACASLWLLFQKCPSDPQDLVNLKSFACLGISTVGRERTWVDRGWRQRTVSWQLTNVTIFQCLQHSTLLEQTLLSIPQPSGFPQPKDQYLQMHGYWGDPENDI